MAIEIYEGFLPIYWKGADFRNMVYSSIDQVDVGNKRRAWRDQITYVRCRSKVCEHKPKCKCPMIKKNLCRCPNGITIKIDQPRKDTKMYKEFKELIEKLPYINFFGRYSDFVWNNRDHTCDQDEYEVLKQIPEFSMSRLTNAGYNLQEALQHIEEHKEFNVRDLNYLRGVNTQLTSTLRNKYKDEIEAYLKLVTMEAFLDKETLRLQQFKKDIGPLFYFCGEYVVMKIPALAEFERYGLQNIFHYSAEAARYSSNGYNAVKVEDFPYIYNYLINYQPSPDLYNADRYQSLYVPVIKEQFPKFCREHNINFAADVV